MTTVPIPQSASEVPGPVPGNTMTNAYVQLVGRMAYVWGYPLVNAHNRRAAFAEAPEPGLLGGVVPVAPVGYNQMLTDYIKPDQTFIVCPNQDVAYGAGFTALDKEPTVIQVPDFGDRFYVYAMYDQRTDEIGRIGKQYGTKPGFYMIVGPNWNGEVPKGITAVVRSSTDLVFVVPRIFKDATPEDTAAVQPLIDQVVMYPLSQFDGTMKTKDYSKSPHFPVPAPAPDAPKGESKWVKPETYYDELPVVMKEVPPLPGEEALYGWIASVWEAAAKNPDTKKALVESFAAADERTRRAALSVPIQRPGGWQRLDRAGECRGVGDGLPEPHRHQQIEHVPEHVGGNAIQFARVRQRGETARRKQSIHRHVREGTSPAREGVLVVDAVQRREVLLSESAEPLLARHEEQDAEIRRGRLADALPGREVAGQGERSELDTGARRPLLADPAALLA